MITLAVITGIPMSEWKGDIRAIATGFDVWAKIQSRRNGQSTEDDEAPEPGDDEEPSRRPIYSG